MSSLFDQVPRRATRFTMLPDILRTVLIAALLCLWEGFPLPLFGLNNILGYQGFAVIVFAGVLLFLYQAATQRIRINIWHVMAMALFISCCISSTIYSVLIKPQPLIAWVPAVYTVAPILTILALSAVGAQYRNAEDALYWTGFLGSALIIVHNLSHSTFLEFYGRGSAFSESRIVFFKLEATFGLIIALMRMAHERSMLRFAGHLAVFAVMGYNVLVLTESRLAIAAFVVAAALCWAFVLRGNRKLLVAVIGPVILVPAVWYFINTYLAGFDGFDRYLANDKSASWRFITIDHFAAFFAPTRGFGFGFMSGNVIYDNVISFSTHVVGERYGVPNYGTFLDDIGLYAALYQYGYLGLALTVVMTFMAAVALIRATALGPTFGAAAGCGWLMLCFLPSPIPFNYFTLFYSAHIGGLLWFMAARVSEMRGVQGNPRTRNRTGSLFGAPGRSAEGTARSPRLDLTIEPPTTKAAGSIWSRGKS